MLDPLIVGFWDGNHIWLQWKDEAPAGYAVRVSYQQPGKAWGDTIEIATPWPTGRSWLSIPTFKQGWMARAEVATWNGGAEMLWRRAKAGRFEKSRCRFEFTVATKVTFPAGTAFHGTVDGEPCSYQTMVEVTLPPKTPTIVWMEAMQSTGFNQIDEANDFLIQPEPGMTVRNVEPSQRDVASLGVYEARIEAAPQSGPMTMTLGPVWR